jgi:hypothetical protein
MLADRDQGMDKWKEIQTIQDKVQYFLKTQQQEESPRTLDEIQYNESKHHQPPTVW